MTVSAVNRVTLKALNPTGDPSAVLCGEGGRNGLFIVYAGTPPKADPAEGVYIVSTTPGYYWARCFNGEAEILWWGAKCDGVTDDTAAVQAAITFCQSTAPLSGVALNISGACWTTAAIFITAGIEINSRGNLGGLFLTDPHVNILVVDTTAAVNLHDLQLSYNGVTGAAGTAALHVTSTATQNSNSRFDNLTVVFANIGIKFGAACYWTVTRSTFQNCQTGVEAWDTYIVDSGDAVIDNNFFLGSGVAAIDYLSGSGLRITNNKINGAQYGVLMQWVGTQTIDGATNKNGADLFIAGNSIEGISVASILLSRTDHSQFGTVLVSDNELSGPRGLRVVDSTTAWLSGLTVSDNVWNGPSGSNNVAFDIGGATGFVVGGNLGMNGGTSPKLVCTTAQSSRGLVGPNHAGTPGYGASSIAAGSASLVHPT